MSGLINKAKDALSGHKTHGSSTNDPAYDNPQSTTAGPHGSNIMNKVDPRVDSDRDHRNDPTSRVGGYGAQDQYGGNQPGYDQGAGAGYGASGPGHTGTHGAGVGATGGYGSNQPGYDNPRSANDGPHNSSMMNKLDPRVDSDRDNRADPTSRVGGYNDQQSGFSNPSGTTGGAGYGSGNTGSGLGGHHSTTGAPGYGSSTNDPAYDNSRSGNAGPHNSAMMNKLDPRVDSDRDNRADPTSRVGGYNDQQSGFSNPTGPTGAGYGNTGGHGYGSNTGAGVGGYNSSSTTAGPHNSSVLNKVDPRVDSDMDNRANPTSRVGGYNDQQSGFSNPTGPTGQGYGSNTTGGVGDFGNTSGTHGHHGHHGHHHQGQHPGQHQQGGFGQDAQEYASAGSGKSTNAGPHNSNLLNKLDPRVDSDLSGGNTYGGDVTRQ